MTGGFEDQVSDFFGVGDQRQVARRQLDGGSVHALGEEAFQVRVDGLVEAGNRVPGRFGMPGRGGGAVGEQGFGDRLLDGEQFHRLVVGHVAGEVFEEGVLLQADETIVLLGASAHGHGRVLGRQRDEVLARVRCPGCNVNQRADVRIDPGFTDHGAGVGVADQHGWAVLLIEHALGGGNVVGDRGQRVLHRRDVQADGLQPGDHVRPTRAIGPGTVHQHDVVGLDRRDGAGHGGTGTQHQQAGGDQAEFAQWFHGVDPCHHQWEVCHPRWVTDDATV